MRRCILSAVALAGTIAVVGSSTASAAVTCNVVASPSGSDSGPGSLGAPYRTVGRLIAALSSGQTGCLRNGTYGGSSSTTMFDRPGITVTSYPGERATIQGYPAITADNVTVAYLNIDLNRIGDPWPALCQGAISGGAVVTYGFVVDGNNATVEHDNIYVDPSVPLTNRGGGIGVGFNNSTSGDVIRYNRIHNVGFCPVEEHGIYLNKTSGAQIYGNWIYDIPAGTGVQVWDGPSKAHIYANVVDGSSSCFDVGGNSGNTKRTLIEHNVCSNSVGVQPPYRSYCASPTGPGCTGPATGAPLFDYWGGGPSGGGNAFQSNLLFCAASAPHCTTDLSDSAGVMLSGNMVGDPRFANAANHDYRVGPGSPAASWALWDGDIRGAPAPGPVSAPSPPVRGGGRGRSSRLDRLISRRALYHKRSRKHHARARKHHRRPDRVQSRRRIR